MVAKRPKDPTCQSPAGTKASKSLPGKNFAKDKKGSHSGAMMGSKKSVDMHKMPKHAKGRNY